MSQTVDWIYLRPPKLSLITPTKKDVLYLIDICSIIRGLYTRRAMEYEIYEVASGKEYPTKFFYELMDFLKYIGTITRNWKCKPYFVIFYDEGGCIQNRQLDPDYKKRTFEFDEYDKLRALLRRHYLQHIPEYFGHIQNVQIINTKEYECDFVSLWKKKDDFFHVVLSNDKDLLQVIDDNTVMLTPQNKLFTRENATTKIHEKVKLDPKYVPLLLAMAGDSADNIPGCCRGYGYVRCARLIVEAGIPPDPFSFPQSIDILLRRIGFDTDRLRLNYQLTSFSEQMKRINWDKIETVGGLDDF